MIFKEELISPRKYSLILVFFGLLLSIAVLLFVFIQLRTTFALNSVEIDYEKLAQIKPTDKIQVYFNKGSDHSYQEGNAREANENIYFQDLIIERINNAEESIDLAVMYLEDLDIIEALKIAETRGIKIRIVTDFEKFKELKELLRDTNIEIIDNNGGIVEEGYTSEKSIMHYKFGLFDHESLDNSYLITTSANWNNKDLNLNANNLVLIQDQGLVKAYLGEFEQLWSGKFNRNKDLTKNRGDLFEIDGRIVELWFSPAEDPFSSFQMRLINLFREAEESIYFAAFNFTLPALSRELDSKFQEGIDLKGVVNDGVWDLNVSVLLDMRGIEHGKLFMPWEKIPFENIRHDAIEGEPAFHYKYFIIDENIAVTGATNPTTSAVYTNDEDLLIIHDPLIANEFKQNFLYHYAKYGGITEKSIIKIEDFDYDNDLITLKNLSNEDINIQNWRFISSKRVLNLKDYVPKKEYLIEEEIIIPAKSELELMVARNFVPNNNINDKFPVTNHYDDGEIYLLDNFDLLHHMIWY